MRRTNEDFKQEVLRRSREYRSKRSRQRKQLLALSCCLAAALFLLWPSGAEKIAEDFVNMNGANAPEAPAEVMPMLPEEGGVDTPTNETSDRPIAPYIGEDVTRVDISYSSQGQESRWSVEGEALEDLRAWSNGLLYEYAEFPEGQSPGDGEGGGAYDFTLTGGAYPGFSYIICGHGDCYLLMEGYWYTVTNPSDPPVPEGEGESGMIRFQDRLLLRADLSPETVSWLEWYNSLSEEGQRSVSSLPQELYELCGYPLAEDTEASAT